MILCAPTYGHTLHIGGSTIELSTVKHTSPGLAIKIADKIFYGALYSDIAPQNTLRIKYNNTDYWLGQYCAPGTYAPAGTNTCIPCGVGHYCTGGHARASCTYGAISCNETTNTTDALPPSGAPTNTLMTLDAVNQFIPITDVSAWRRISCCNSPQYVEANPNNPSALNNSKYACATGTLGPGTYLFTTYYRTAGFSTTINSISGETGSISIAYIAVFDHPVSYASFHGDNVFQHFIDLEHPTYTQWTISTATSSGDWRVNQNETNILNLKNILDGSWAMLCVYELK